MLINNGDKLVVKKDVAEFLKEGSIVEVVDVNEGGFIAFAFGDELLHKGMMSMSECEEYFEKYEEPKKEAPTITPERIEEIMNNSEVYVDTVFDKCTVVTCKLPNGFVITESSACVSPENYNEDTGFDICMERIVNKVWELEGYKLQSELYEAEMELLGTEECPYDCNECPCDGCDEEELTNEEDEELKIADESDCEDCDDYDCPLNPNYSN